MRLLGFEILVSFNEFAILRKFVKTKSAILRKYGEIKSAILRKYSEIKSAILGNCVSLQRK